MKSPMFDTGEKQRWIRHFNEFRCYFQMLDKIIGTAKGNQKHVLGTQRELLSKRNLEKVRKYSMNGKNICKE